MNFKEYHKMNVENEFPKLTAKLDLLVERINKAETGYIHIQSAHNFAKNAHENQRRYSGAPYITHPIEVALLIRSKGYSIDTMIAGLLHDIIEDTNIALAELNDKFGEKIAKVVCDVTKLSRLFHKDVVIGLQYFLSTFQDDPQAVIIKLFDRLENLRELYFLPPLKRKRIAEETIEVYAPVANKLGFNDIAQEMADLATLYIDSSFKGILSKYIDYRHRYWEGRVDWGRLDSPLIIDFNEQYKDISRAQESLPKDFQVNVPPKMLKKIESRLNEIEKVLKTPDNPSFKDLLGSIGPLDLKGVFNWIYYLSKYSSRAREVYKILKDKNISKDDLSKRLKHVDKKCGGIKDIIVAFALGVKDDAILHRILQSSNRLWHSKTDNTSKKRINEKL